MTAECLTDEALQVWLDRLWNLPAGERTHPAEDLLEFLVQSLGLDLACIRLRDFPAGPAHDIVASSGGLPRDEIGALLQSARAQTSWHLPDRAGGGLSIVGLQLGADGALLAGSRRAGFPGAQERLLLTAAVGRATAFEAAVNPVEGRPPVKEGEAAQATRTVYLQQIIDMIPALAWASTTSGMPEFFNQYYLDYVGHSWDEMIGDGWTANLHPDDLPALAADWTAIMASRRPGESQARMRRADGEYRWFLFRANPLLDDAGNVIRWIGVNTDIEDRKHAEDMLRDTQTQLAHMNRAITMGQLTASIAHELNQPLAGIMTNAGTCLRMLSAKPPNIDGARETVRRTIRDGDRASEVIARLRALFSSKAASAVSLDLNAATQEVIALAATELQRRDVRLRTDLTENLPLVTGDRIQLQQVILNLIINAAESMADVESRPRHLTVSTAREGPDRVRLAVKDLGIGLDFTVVEKLFTPFYTTKKAGMGIGLSVSRTIIEHHQGRIWAEPNDGPGATFAFSIPARHAEEARALPEQPG